jgi:hypothetical protein
VSIQASERALPELRGAACASISAQLGEPLAGTAPRGVAWIAVEDRGTWASRAVRDSEITWLHELDSRASAVDVGVMLIRRPGRAGREPADQRHVILATTLPGRSAAEVFAMDPNQDLLDLDVEALAAGNLPGRGARVEEPMLLVCTNGRRDPCCSVAGRALADRLSAAAPQAVWECSHLGGHRFAPTALSLPSGYVYGRLTVDIGLGLLRQPMSAPPLVEHCRGRTTWDPLGQAAELAVRANEPHLDADALTVGTKAEDQRQVTVAGGRRHVVTLQRNPVPQARAISCGADPTTPMVVSVVEQQLAEA